MDMLVLDICFVFEFSLKFDKHLTLTIEIKPKGQNSYDNVIVKFTLKDNQYQYFTAVQ